MEKINSYEMEVSCKDIFSKMKQNTYNYYQSNILSSLDKNYLILRKSLISTISKISNQMGFKSQTYFLAVYYLDLIFTKEKDSELSYGILALACLVVASKYNENSPMRPVLKFFVYLYNENRNEKKISKEDLCYYEVIVCKILEYKLNYCTIYDFNLFIFRNEVIKGNILKEMIYNLFIKRIIPDKNLEDISNLKEILVKVYDKSRFYLENIINNLICLKYNSFFISLHIMGKSIEKVLLSEFSYNGKITDNIKKEKILLSIKKYFKNIIEDFYKINYEYIAEYRELVTECENLNIFKNLNETTNKKINQALSKNKYQNNNMLYIKANLKSLQASNKKFNNRDSFSIKVIEKNKERNIEDYEQKENIINFDKIPKLKMNNIRLQNKNFKHLSSNQELLSHVKDISDLSQKNNNLYSTKSKVSIINYNMLRHSKILSFSNYNSKNNDILNSEIKPSNSIVLGNKNLLQKMIIEQFMFQIVSTIKQLKMNLKIN